MFNSPIRPDLSMSTKPEECDFIAIDLSARSVQVRLSGMLTPVLTYDGWVNSTWGVEGVPRILVGPMTGGTDLLESDIERGLREQVQSGARIVRVELPRGTLYGGALDYVFDCTRGDPRSAELHANNMEEYVRLTGMRRGREEIEAEWRKIEACKSTGKHPGLEPYPPLTEPGLGCFLS